MAFQHIYLTKMEDLGYLENFYFNFPTFICRLASFSFSFRVRGSRGSRTFSILFSLYLLHFCTLVLEDQTNVQAREFFQTWNQTCTTRTLRPVSLASCSRTWKKNIEFEKIHLGSRIFILYSRTLTLVSGEFSKTNLSTRLGALLESQLELSSLLSVQNGPRPFGGLPILTVRLVFVAYARHARVREIVVLKKLVKIKVS